MRDQLRQSFALFPCRSDPRIGIAKPGESCVDEFICGRRTTAGSLSIERPAKNELRRTIMFNSHLPEPMVDERGFPDTGPGKNRNDIYVLICPCVIQESDILLPAKNIASCNG